jgi:hypothetical protein
MKLRLFTRTIALSMLAATMFAVPLAGAQTVTLDGRVFVVDSGVKGKAADVKGDVLTFAGGRFHSRSGDNYRYDKGDYRASASGDAVSFEAETRSDNQGKLRWKGTVRGNEIEGTFTEHPKPGLFTNFTPEPIEHWFKGRAKS